MQKIDRFRIKEDKFKENSHDCLPSGVPVKITSPGFKVKPSERLSIIAGILKIILLVLLSCFFSSFKKSFILKSLGSRSVKNNMIK